MSQDLNERRAAALESAAARVDDPAERAVLGRVRTLLRHPAAWAPAPEITVPPLLVAAEPAEVAAPVPASAPGRWRSRLAGGRTRRWAGGRTRRWVLAFGAVATAAAAVVIGFAVVPQPDRESARIDLVGTPLAAEARASATATRFEAGWHLTLDIQDLAPAAPGEYYQGWVVRGGTYVSLGTFHLREPGEVELWAGVDVREFDRVEVTRQRVDGGQDPAEVVLAGPIPGG